MLKKGRVVKHKSAHTFAYFRIRFAQYGYFMRLLVVECVDVFVERMVKVTKQKTMPQSKIDETGGKTCQKFMYSDE